VLPKLFVMVCLRAKWCSRCDKGARIVIWSFYPARSFSGNEIVHYDPLGKASE
jgi:hypothetical protein